MTVMGKYFQVIDLQGSVSILLTLSEKGISVPYSDGSMAIWWECQQPQSCWHSSGRQCYLNIPSKVPWWQRQTPIPEVWALPQSCFFCLFVCLFFRATPVPHGRSQVRGRIGAAAASLGHSHSHAGSGCICDLHHSSWQSWIFNPLSKTRDYLHPPGY